MIKVTVSVPAWRFKDKAWVESVATTMKTKTYHDLRALFLKTVFGWSAKNKPSFTRHLTRRAASLSMAVYSRSSDDIYNLVNVGSPPHKIPTSGTTYMHFKRNYKPATIVGQIQSRRAYKLNPWVTMFKVSHPGFEGRHFDELIAETYYDTFVKDIEDTFTNTANS